MGQRQVNPPTTMSKPKRILALAGSARRDSLHKKLAQRAADLVRTHGLEVQWLDLADFELPIYHGDLEAEQGQPAKALVLRALVKSHDALIIASPEYNGFFSPLLKNTLDWLSRPLPGEERHATFKDKPVLLLATARGESGGARGLQTLGQLLTNLKALPHRRSFALPNGPAAFETRDRLQSDQAQRLAHLVHEFIYELQHPSIDQPLYATI
jgi:NAD(P)H-dependent FMN reductase